MSIACEQAPCPIDGRHGKDAREDRPQSATDAMNAPHVEWIIPVAWVRNFTAPNPMNEGNIDEEAPQDEEKEIRFGTDPISGGTNEPVNESKKRTEREYLPSPSFEGIPILE